jgi:hypothetical protein
MGFSEILPGYACPHRRACGSPCVRTCLRSSDFLSASVFSSITSSVLSSTTADKRERAARVKAQARVGCVRCVCVRARGSSLRVLLRVGVCGLRRVVDSLVGCEQVCDTGKTLTIKFLLGQDRAHAQTVFIWCCLRHRLRHEAHIVPNRRMRGQVLWRWWNAGLIHAAFLRHVSRPRLCCSLPGAW